MRARYTDTARDEADHILAHIANDSSTAAGDVAAIIETTIARLLAFPQLGSQTDVTGVRVAIARPHSARACAGATPASSPDVRTAKSAVIASSTPMGEPAR